MCDVLNGKRQMDNDANPNGAAQQGATNTHTLTHSRAHTRVRQTQSHNLFHILQQLKKQQKGD